MSLLIAFELNTISAFHANALKLLNQHEAKKWREFWGAEAKVKQARRRSWWDGLLNLSWIRFTNSELNPISS